MAEKLYEIAFRGQVADGADLDSVKAKIAAMFKADENRLQQLFSGRRVVIKRQADEVTVAKYRGAFHKAGASCEVVELGGDDPAPTNDASANQPSTSTATPNPSESGDYVSRYPESDEVPQALLTDPLGISGDSISDLGADLAPVGSSMLQDYSDIPEPDIDLAGLDIAPVGSDLSSGKKEAVPPPPDTSGIELAD